MTQGRCLKLKRNLRTTDLKRHERKIKARFYRWVWNTYGGLWQQAAAELKAVTGVDIPQETLRQNIEPVNQLAGEEPRRFRDPKRLRALKDFLVSVNYLLEEELQETSGFSYLAEVFSRFVSDQQTMLDTGPLEQFRGLFRGERTTASTKEVVELRVDYLSPDRPVAVFEGSTTYEAASEEVLDQENAEGWAICNENGFYVFLLKRPYASHCYSVIQTSPSITRDIPVNAIGLLAYESALTGPLQVVTRYEDKEDKGATQSEFHLSSRVEELYFILTRC
ncbi:MAG: hypothetical protein AB2809_21310 [Candidatus Thiodiazotropha sp.]